MAAALPNGRIVSAGVLLALALTLPATALEKPTKAELARYRADGTLAARIAAAHALGNDRVNPTIAARLQQRLMRLRLKAAGKSDAEIDRLLSAVLPSGEHPGLRSTGTNRIFALLIDFPDYPSTVPAGSISSALFGDGSGGFPYESLRNYYQRSSYNLLDIEGVTLGYYRPAYARSAVQQTTLGREALIKEALTYFDAQGHDFSQYDNDNNGTIDYFCVLWTGPDDGWASFWWGYSTGWTSSFSLDGKQFAGSSYSWQWVTRPSDGTAFSPQVVIHETGHALGLPDLYDYDESDGAPGGVGGLDMMDANWGDHNGFSKMMLDWVTPTVAASGSSYLLRPSGSFPDAVIMWPGYSLASPYGEFFIVQNRTRVGNDAPCPNDGLLIWHIDARLTDAQTFAWDNSWTSHKLVRLMEADGLEEIEKPPTIGPYGFYVYVGANASDYYTPGSGTHFLQP